MPANSGPISGVCAISTGGPPETIAQTRIGCGGFQLHGPSGDAKTTDPADGQKLIEGIDSYDWNQEAIIGAFPACVQTPENCQLTQRGVNVPTAVVPRRRFLNARQQSKNDKPLIVTEGRRRRFDKRDATSGDDVASNNNINNDGSITLNAGWAKNASLTHYGTFFNITLNVPKCHDTPCSMIGNGLTSKWCHCHLTTPQDSSSPSADVCIGMVEILSSDPYATSVLHLPSRMIMQWRTGGWYPGPAHG